MKSVNLHIEHLKHKCWYLNCYKSEYIHFGYIHTWHQCYFRLIWLKIILKHLSRNKENEMLLELMTVHSRINVYNQPPARTRGSRFIALHRREWYFNRMFEGLLFLKGNRCGRVTQLLCQWCFRCIPLESCNIVSFKSI